MSTHAEDLENELVNNPQRVLLIAGAGVSMATAPSNPCAGWIGLLRHGLQRCRDRCPALKPERIGRFEAHVQDGDLLPVATFISEQLRAVREGEYDTWLSESVGRLAVADDKVIRALSAWGVQIATTNYDNLIEQVTHRTAVTWREPGRVVECLRNRDSSVVLHLHGHYQFPRTVILDAKNYQDICKDQPTQVILPTLLVERTLVFVGCGAGLSDPNFGQLLDWSRDALQHFKHTHYRLVRDSELHQVADECRGLTIQPMTFGPNYDDLAAFLSAIGERVRRRCVSTSAVDLLVRGQTDYLSRRERLEAERHVLSSGEYVRRYLELTRDLWQAGGRRQAVLEMNGVFFRESTNLTVDERMQFGLDLAEMLLDDDLPRYAGHVLHPMQGEIGKSAIPTATVERFRHLHLRCLNDVCAHREALDAIDHALRLTTGDERAQLQAERGEIQLLQGELDDALRSVTDSERC